MGLFTKAESWGSYLYVLFRVLVGVLFFMHGWGKLFGEKAMPLASLMGAAGVIEVAAGIAVVLGLFVRLFAALAAIEMVVAFVMMHAPKGLNPMANGGELAVMYFAAFLVLFSYGAGKLALERTLLNKEMF